MNHQTPSKNNEPCVPDTYKEILYCRPSTRTYYGDECTDAVCCICCSPIILPVWIIGCLGVSSKKTVNACRNCSISNNRIDTIVFIDEQPSQLTHDNNTTNYTNLTASIK